MRESRRGEPPSLSHGLRSSRTFVHPLAHSRSSIARHCHARQLLPSAISKRASDHALSAVARVSELSEGYFHRLSSTRMDARDASFVDEGSSAGCLRCHACISDARSALPQPARTFGPHDALRRSARTAAACLPAEQLRALSAGALRTSSCAVPPASHRLRSSPTTVLRTQLAPLSLVR